MMTKKKILAILLFLLVPLLSQCFRGESRKLANSQGQHQFNKEGVSRDTQPGTTNALPTTNVQPSAFPVFFQSVTDEPVTIYFTVDGSPPDFFSETISATQVVTDQSFVPPSECGAQSQYKEICVTQDTNIRWFSVDRNNNREDEKSVVYRVRDARQAVEIQAVSAINVLGYDGSNNPPPVVVEWRSLFQGRVKFCVGSGAPTYASDNSKGFGSNDDSHTAVSQGENFDIFAEVNEMFEAGKEADPDNPPTLEDIDCAGNSNLRSVSQRESDTGLSFPDLAPGDIGEEDVLDSQNLKIPVKALYSSTTDGLYQNYVFVFFEIHATDGSVQGLAAKSVVLYTDAWKPQVFATLDSGTYGTYRYLYLYSDDSVNDVYYRLGTDSDPITRQDKLYNPADPILLDEDKSIRFAAIDPTGNTSPVEQRDYVLNLQGPQLSFSQPDRTGAVYHRYHDSQLGNGSSLNITLTGNEETAVDFYFRLGGGTLQEAFLAEMASAGTGIETGFSSGGDPNNGATTCVAKACKITFGAGVTPREIDLDLRVYTEMEYLALSDYGDRDPGASSDDFQVIVTPPSDSANSTDDGSNPAFAPSGIKFLPNEQKIVKTQEIKVQHGVNYDTGTEILTALDLRDKVMVEYKYVTDSDGNIIWQPGDLDTGLTAAPGTVGITSAYNAQFDFTSAGRPGHNTKLYITYKYLEPMSRKYFIYGSSGDPNDEIQESVRSLVYREVNQDITAVLYKRHLEALPSEYLDQSAPGYKPIRLLNMSLRQIVADAPCNGDEMLKCTLEIIKNGNWNCSSGNPRSLSAAWRSTPESIPTDNGTINGICPGEVADEKQRISMQYLLTMTPKNADVSGTPIEDMMDLTEWIIDNLPTNYDTRAAMFADLMEITEDDPFVATDVVKFSIFRNLIRNHPYVNDSDGTLPFFLADAVTDLATFSERFILSGTMPGGGPTSGTRSAGDNLLGGQQIAEKNTSLVRNGTGWKGFLFDPIPATEVMYDNKTASHDAFAMKLPSNVTGTVNEGIALRVNSAGALECAAAEPGSTEGQSCSARLLKNPLNKNNLSIFPDQGVSDSGDGVRDCSATSYAGINGTTEGPGNYGCEDNPFVDSNGIGMRIQGLNSDIRIDMPFAMSGVQDKANVNMGSQRNNGYGSMHPWTQGGIHPGKYAGSYEALFALPSTPNNSYLGGLGLTHFPDSFPDSCWDSCVTHAEPQNYDRPYRVEYILHDAGWAQYHHLFHKELDFDLVIDLGWLGEIRITLAEITRRDDSWTTINMDTDWVLELLGFYIPDSDFFLFETISVAAQKRLFDMAPSTNGDDVGVKFLIPDVPVGLTETVMVNGIKETFTSEGGIDDLKTLASDIFGVQDDLPDVYVDKFTGSDSCASRSAGSTTCETESLYLVFNEKTYDRDDNVLWRSQYHQVGQQCAGNTDYFCGRKNSSLSAPYFWDDYIAGTLTNPFNQGDGANLKIVKNGKLQIYDTGLNDFRDAYDHEEVVYYMETVDNKTAATYVFQLHFSQPQASNDISFTWRRVE